MNTIGPYIHTPLANAFSWLVSDEYADKHSEFKGTKLNIRRKLGR